MFPALLDLSVRPVLVVGAGEARARRLALAREAGACDLRVYGPPRLPGAREMAGGVVLIAGLEAGQARQLAQTARQAGALVNVEDVAEQCDFHVPAIVRRGDLLLTVSTGGKAPALSRALREELEMRFGDEWAARLEALANARARWRREGAGIGDLSRRARQMIEEEGWLR